jgi:hypothetical protein
MKKILIAAAVVGVVAAAVQVGFTQSRPAASPSIEGAWKRTSVVVTGANASNTPQASNIYIYGKKYYAHVIENQPRKPLPPPKDPNKVTDAEKIAAYEAWAPLNTHAGTYEIKGNTIIHHQMVSKAPTPAAGRPPAGGPLLTDARIEANTIVRTVKSADGKSVTTTTYTRLE